MRGEVDVRPVSNTKEGEDQARLEELMAFPACLASLLEAKGEDPLLYKTVFEGQTVSRRGLYDKILAASGMAFGLLWQEELCYSSLDLMQLQPHNETIQHAFDQLAYDYQIVEKTEASSQDALFQRIRASIDEGSAVLAFGIVGPPECSLITAYDDEEQLLFGYSHFQSRDPAQLDEAGRFIIKDWYEPLWKLVFCQEKRVTSEPLVEVFHRAYKISTTKYVDGYYAGAAAYDAWVDFLKNSSFQAMDDDSLKQQYQFHQAILTNLAHLRSSLAAYLRQLENETLAEVAVHCDEILNLAKKAEGLALDYGHTSSGEAWQLLRDDRYCQALADKIREIDSEDKSVSNALMMWYAKHGQAS